MREYDEGPTLKCNQLEAERKCQMPNAKRKMPYAKCHYADANAKQQQQQQESSE